MAVLRYVNLLSSEVTVWRHSSFHDFVTSIDAISISDLVTSLWC